MHRLLEHLNDRSGLDAGRYYIPFVTRESEWKFTAGFAKPSAPYPRLGLDAGRKKALYSVDEGFAPYSRSGLAADGGRTRNDQLGLAQ